MQLFGGGQVLVHQHADGNGQRLGADIARHIQHHGLEADDDGQDSHHRLKGTHHRGHQHPEEEQSDQPGQALLDTLEDALVQIFFAGQAAQLCVIVAHLSSTSSTTSAEVMMPTSSPASFRTGRERSA